MIVFLERQLEAIEDGFYVTLTAKLTIYQMIYGSYYETI